MTWLWCDVNCKFQGWREKSRIMKWDRVAEIDKLGMNEIINRVTVGMRDD